MAQQQMAQQQQQHQVQVQQHLQMQQLQQMQQQYAVAGSIVADRTPPTVTVMEPQQAAKGNKPTTRKNGKAVLSI